MFNRSMKLTRLSSIFLTITLLISGGMLSGFQTARGGTIGLSAPTQSSVLHQVSENQVTVGQPVRPSSFDGDVRDLPQVPDTARSQFYLRGPQPNRAPALSGPAGGNTNPEPAFPNAMPAATSFAGLGMADTCSGVPCGNGYPPDTNGDVGPNHYIETVNTSIGIYNKTGTLLASFTFNAFFAAALAAAPCSNSNQGDPVALYDPLTDRWILADFAWTNSPANFLNGPYYECIAVSKTSDPVTGGWWVYVLRADDDTHPWLNDYPKLGVWSDGIYMSANMFDITSGTGSATYKGVRVWALNRDDLISGAALRSQYHDTSSSYFALLPGNLRGALPPAGTPEYFVSQDQSYYWDVFMFHVDWATPSSSSFSVAPTQVTQSSYGYPFDSSFNTDIVPQPSTTTPLDSLGDRLMVQAQYRNIAGTESLWVVHTVRPSGVSSGPTGLQWAQINVTGGTVATTPVQEQIYTHGGDGIYRWMPSLAVDSAGNMVVGFSASDGTSTYPSLYYAGRLAGDTLNTLAQGEAVMLAGTAPQNVTCGGSACTRWGDYSAMTVDPIDGCTFWYTNEYYASGDTAHWKTQIGKFTFPSCTSGPDVWIGAGPDNNTSTPNNWSRGVPGPGDDAYFTNISSKNATLDADLSAANLTINAGYGGTISLGSHNLTLSNIFTQAGGAFDGGSGTTSIGGSLNRTGGTFTPSNGSVNFTGSGIQTISGDTSFFNLTVGSGITLTTSSNISLNGTLTNNGWTKETRAVSGTPTLNFGLGGITVAVTSGGSLSSLQVVRRDQDAPDASSVALQTGKYWVITPTGAVGSFSLTLPHNNLLSPRVCEFPGGSGGYGWDCDDGSHTSSTSSTVTRTGLTSFSEWTVGTSAGPTAVTLSKLAGSSDPDPWPLMGLLAILGLVWFGGLAVIYTRRLRHKIRRAK
jgi:hypothetical protein